MFRLLKTDEKMIIKRNSTFVIVGIVAAIMAVAGITLLFSLFPLESDDTFANIFGVVFVSVWLAIVFGLGIFSFAANSKKLTIDNDGILSQSWFNTKRIKWADVKDWGLSYCGQTRWEGNTYYLYFAEYNCPAKNECSKKLKGKMIKTIVIGDDYFRMIEKVIPFCEEKTNVTAFIGKDKYHSV